MEKVKQRILDILESSAGKKANEDNIKDLFGKLQTYLNKINSNSIKLYFLLNQNTKNTILAKLNDDKEVTSFDDYLELNLPLYLVHFLKQCEEKNLIESNNIVINCFENLKKENIYQKKRGCNQFVLMWKEIYPNKYKILSFISSNFNEFDFDEKKYFITMVGGDTLEESDNSWKNYNSTNILDLLSGDSYLLSLEDGIKKMLD
mgnify:CR=1 FL=1